MLADLIHLLATPAPRAQRRLGYVGDSVRLMGRARRCRAAWAPHLAASRAVIAAAAVATSARGTAVVLGSGPLADVPLATLAGAFRRVVLVDAVHSWPARLLARRFPNVACLTADLSGAQALLLGRAQDLAPGLPPVCAEPGTDLVISVNLLSQLPIRPVDRLEARRRPLGRWRPGDGDRFGRAIVDGHLAALAGLRARVCLIGDLEETQIDRDGRVLDRLDLLYGADLGPPERVWDWDLAPFGEAVRDRRLVHRVAAFTDWRPPA